jgi:imidazole glycerol-phosphate synthase subunit HisH
MITVIDYALGNVGSVSNMLKKIGAPARIARTAEEIAEATALVLPGVGHFDEGMRSLEESGLRRTLDERFASGIPVLGICLGVQLMARMSEEGSRRGLGWLRADVRRFRLEPPMTVPHMGWNQVEASGGLFEGIEQPRFYFVHSFHLVCDDEADVCGWTRYGYRFAAAVQHDRVFGTQFHPEKSHRFGMTLLRNFVRLTQHG